MGNATQITSTTGALVETLTIRPTGKTVLIPVTAMNGSHGFIRRELYVSDSGRLFVLNAGEFDEVRQDALGRYRLINAHFIMGEWHRDTIGRLVPGPEPRMPITPAWVVPGVEDLKPANDPSYEYGFGL